MCRSGMERSNNEQNTQIEKIQLTVRNPVTHNTWDKGQFTTYLISIETNDIAFSLFSSSVRRRYSEFVWLRKQLQQHHSTDVVCPVLPPKKFFSFRFNDNFIQERMKGLQAFLEKCVNETVFLSDTKFHLFVQSNLTTAQIEEILHGGTATNNGVLDIMVRSQLGANTADNHNGNSSQTLEPIAISQQCDDNNHRKPSTNAQDIKTTPNRTDQNRSTMILSPRQTLTPPGAQNISYPNICRLIKGVNAIIIDNGNCSMCARSTCDCEFNSELDTLPRAPISSNSLSDMMLKQNIVDQDDPKCEQAEAKFDLDIDQSSLRSRRVSFSAQVVIADSHMLDKSLDQKFCQQHKTLS